MAYDRSCLRAWAACVPVAVFSLVAPAAVADTIPFIVPVEQTTTVTARVTRGADTIVESDTTPEYTYVFDPAQPFRPHPGVIGVELELSDRSQYSAASDPLELGLASAGLDGAGVTTARIDAALTGSDAFDPTILRAEVVQISRAGVPGGAAQLGYEFWLGDMLIEIWDANRIGGGPDPFADPTGGSGAIGARFWYEVRRDGDLAIRFDERVWTDENGELQSPIGAYSVNGTDVFGRNLPAAFTRGDLPQAGDLLGGKDFIRTSFQGARALDLGPVERGTEFEVEVRMGAELYLPAFGLGTGGVITISDPSGFEGAGLGVFRAIPAGGPAPVPLPAGVWLLLAGLCGMVALRRAGG